MQRALESEVGSDNDEDEVELSAGEMVIDELITLISGTHVCSILYILEVLFVFVSCILLCFTFHKIPLMMLMLGVCVGVLYKNYFFYIRIYGPQ